MSAHDFLEAKALRLSMEHGGTVVTAADLKDGDRFFPAANNGAQVFTVTDVQVDPSPWGNTRDWIMVSTAEGDPHRCGRHDRMVKLDPALAPVQAGPHHWDAGHRADPMTGELMCLTCGGPQDSPEHW